MYTSIPSCVPPQSLGDIVRHHYLSFPSFRSHVNDGIAEYHTSRRLYLPLYYLNRQSRVLTTETYTVKILYVLNRPQT